MFHNLGGSGNAGDSGGMGGGPRMTRSGGCSKFLIIIVFLLFAGGGGIGGLFSGGSGGGLFSDSGLGDFLPSDTNNQSDPYGDLATLLGNLGGGSVSSGWDNGNNAGSLDTSVDSNARDKYTQIRGNGRDEVTLMVYLCGTDLESRSKMATSDLQEMINADLSKKVNIIVYTGGTKTWQNNAISSKTNQIWQVKDDGIVCLEKNLGSKSMTDPNTLTSFINYCKKNFPADRNSLIFWDHGGGSVSGYGYDEKFASSGSMSLAEIDDALTAAKVKFDFVGFDACLMATTENALMLTEHADYLIASEETEPGIGWYYTDWLSELSANTSMSTLEIGKNIIDDFVDTCGRKCPGQSTTLSIVDLAELEATVPEAFVDFSNSTYKLIKNNNYAQVSNARSGAREFGSSSKIDQVDLVHLAKNMNTTEGDALAKILLSAVKYNRTSSNMTNSYGLSIYFPYRKASMVDDAVDTYEQIGLDNEYARCIQAFASMEVSGQAASGGTSSPVPSLMDMMGGGSSSYGNAQMIEQLLGQFLGGNVGSISGLSYDNIDFFSGRALDETEMAQYISEHSFDSSVLTWEDTKNGPAVVIREEQLRKTYILRNNWYL